MNKIRVGITGQDGFIGSHLSRWLHLNGNIECINFHKSFFYDKQRLNNFVCNCDVIVHLAAVNRCENQTELYNTNVGLVTRIITACEETHVFPHIIFASSTQEDNNTPYGNSKVEGKKLLTAFAVKHESAFTAFIIPNVFGEFCRPHYNSVVATFAYQCVNNESPTVLADPSISFIYAASLCKLICDRIEDVYSNRLKIQESVSVPEDFKLRISDLAALFGYFKSCYFEKGIIPTLRDKHELHLFNTFRSYIDIKKHFPLSLEPHSDERGVFVETIKLGIGGQVSFSTTKPSITRGNHFHTRKIERFIVIKGKAKISLRKIGSTECIDLFLDGKNPSYVDMPVWYTHNITNIGDEDLYTQFWINEWYDPNDADTFYELV